MMNAEQQHNRSPAENANTTAPGLQADPMWSALADGALTSSDIDALLASIDSSPGVLSDWHSYQVIGEVLRGHGDPTGVTPATDFLAAVRIGIEAGNAGTDALARGPVRAELPVANVRGQAANDAVFRWKVVAGLASLAAVMAVSWTLLAGSAAGPDGTAGAQLAAAPNISTTEPASAVNEQSVPGSAAVLVGTGQGVLIRDAQLEALLAEHRQHGGVSALQMPSGFIRNATYEAEGR